MLHKNYITLQRGSSEPLYRQVYLRFRQAIATGTLPPGSRVPSIRSLAGELKLSRNTIEMAYDLLIGEGYFVARGQAGTVVSPQLQPGLVKSVLSSRPRAAVPPPASPSHDETGPQLFQLGLPALDAFPRKLWANLNSRRLRTLDATFLTHTEAAGYHPLREAISGYLHISRGLACTPAQVFVTTGYRGAMKLVGRSLLQPADAVWIEDPCFPPTRSLFAEMGIQPVPVPVDDEGINVAAGIARAPRARFAAVTPAHQSPLGVSLSLMRRLELLAWAEQTGAWIIEDDYDSEYRYVGRPLPALSSLDRAGRVIYVGTFSKVLYPALRLGYVVVPQSLVTRFTEICRTLHDGCATLPQAVVADFITEGHFARHVKKMRQLYAERRAAVIAGLQGVFGDRFKFEAPPGGLHLLARLADQESDVALASAAKAAGLAVEPLSPRAIEHPCGQGLLLGFANIASEAAARQAARRLEAALR